MPKRINENELAKDITLIEGKHMPVSIAQVKEILKIALERLSSFKASQVMELVERHKI